MHPRALTLLAAILGLLSVHVSAQYQGRGLNLLTNPVCFANATDSIINLLSSNQSSRPSINTTRALVEAALRAYTSTCLSAEINVAPIRILVPLAPQLPTWRNRAALFTNRTGVRIILETVDPAEVTNEIIFELQTSPRRDGWVFNPTGLGPIGQLQGFADLANLTRDTDTLQFWDYNVFFRQTSARYQGQLVGIPLDGRLFLMYYRQDLMDRYNVPMPHTWDELLAVAKWMNGTDTDGDGVGDLYGACFDVAPGCKGGHLVAAVAASYLQYQGTTQGFWFDPDKLPWLDPLVDNPGFEAALKFWRDLEPYTNPMKTCNVVNSDFQAGRCFFTINWGSEMRALLTNPKLNRQGVVGVSPLPGTSTVYNRATQSLMPCDIVSCPFATLHNIMSSDAQELKSSTPFPAFGGYMGGVSRYANNTRRILAYQFLSLLASPTLGWEDVLSTDPAAGVDPYRDSQLLDLERWVSAGYTRSLAQSYLTASRTSLSNHNIALDSRLVVGPNSLPYTANLDAALWNVTREKNASLWNVMQTLDRLYNVSTQGAVSKLYGGDPLMLAQQYWDVLNKPGNVAALVAKPHHASPDLPTTLLIISIVVPVSVIALILLVLLVRYLNSRRVRNHVSLLGKVLPPGLGLQTTLVVTDIQDSTLLYEALPMNIMDEAMQIGCKIIRACAQQHLGYESVTEGDSFTIAFHTAQSAIMFCADLQVAFLEANWPPELLAVTDVPSTHVLRVKPGPEADTCMQIMRANTSPAWKRVIMAQKQHKFRVGAGPAQRLLRSLMSARHSSPGSSNAASTSSTTPSSVNPHAVMGKELLELMMQNEIIVESMEDDGSDDSEKRKTQEMGTVQPNEAPEEGRGARIFHNSEFSEPLTQLESSVLAAPPMDELAQQVVGTTTFKNLYTKAWQPGSAPYTSLQGTESLTGGKQMIWRGLRIRCGVSSGLSDPKDFSYTGDMGPTQYRGRLVAVTKLMEACAHGGQIIMHLNTFQLLDKKVLPEDLVVLHMGKHVIKSSAARPSDMVPAPAKLPDGHMAMVDPDWDAAECDQSAVQERADFGLNPMTPDWHHIYQVLHASQTARLAFLAPLKVERTIVNGIWAAPLGHVTIVFLSVVGVPALRAWDDEKTNDALVMFASIAKQHLRRLGGYLVEHNDDFMLASFKTPLPALQWALALQRDMLYAPWTSALLKQALAEELLVPSVDSQGNHSNIILFRGPRLKVGMSTGYTRSEVHPNTARVSYRGKVMNRAARIAAMATTGQVLCQEGTWEGAAAALGLPPGTCAAGGINCVRLGPTQLKGIKEKVHVCQVHLGAESAAHAPRSTGTVRAGANISTVTSAADIPASQNDWRVPSYTLPQRSSKSVSRRASLTLVFPADVSGGMTVQRHADDSRISPNDPASYLYIQDRCSGSSQEEEEAPGPPPRRARAATTGGDYQLSHNNPLYSPGLEKQRRRLADKQS